MRSDAPIPLDDEPAVPNRPVRPIGAADDLRPLIPEPPPVRLAAVRDVTLPMRAGLEHKVVPFYVGLLRFRRLPDGAGGVAFEAERHALHFCVSELSPERDAVRPLGVLTPFFNDIVSELDAIKYDYELVRGLVAGDDAVLLQDPAGNWLAVAPLREVR